MSTAALHLVLGDEPLLVERAVAAAIGVARAVDPSAEVQTLRAGEVTGPELAESLSPSLFSTARVLVLHAAHEAGKDAAALVSGAAQDLPEGVTLVVEHSGAARNKALVDVLRKAGARVHPCTGLKGSDVADFVRSELKDAGARAEAPAVSALVDAVGSDLRELSSAVAQLVADTGGSVDAAAVARYHRGRAEVSGFAVAEHAVAGQRVAALESLRWARNQGLAHVLLADALADAVRTIARVASAGRGDPSALASQLGMAPWKVNRAAAQSRGWSPSTLGAALQVVAGLNADVKGVAADADYAVERAVLAVLELRNR